MARRAARAADDAPDHTDDSIVGNSTSAFVRSTRNTCDAGHPGNAAGKRNGAG